MIEEIELKNQITLLQIAQELGAPLAQVRYVVTQKLTLTPVSRVETLVFYDRSKLEEIDNEIKLIERKKIAARQKKTCSCDMCE